MKTNGTAAKDMEMKTNPDGTTEVIFAWIFLDATNKLYIYVCYVYDSFNIIQTTTIQKA